MTWKNWTSVGTLLFGFFIAAYAAESPRADPGADALLNEYYAAVRGQPNEALAILEGAARRFPDDPRIQIEIAYHSLRAGDKSRALGALRTAVALTPDRTDCWRQIGYIEIDLQHFEAALAAFLQARKLDPADEQTSMQIGYLQQRLGNRKAAGESFRSVLNSTNGVRSEQAREAYRSVRDAPGGRLPTPWFAEAYLAPEYRSHDDVAVLPIEARIGASFGATTVVDTYASLRATRDSRSGLSHFGPETYFDNAAVLAAGLRLKPSTDLPLSLFVEAGAAADLVDRDRKRWRSDVRGGAIVYRQWDPEPSCPAVEPFPLCFVADLYADAVYYSRYDDNVLFYARLRPGIRLTGAPPEHALDAYLMGALTADTRNVPDNQFRELGAGLALQVFEPFRWVLRAEMVDVWRHENEDALDFRLRLEHQIRF